MVSLLGGCEVKTKKRSHRCWVMVVIFLTVACADQNEDSLKQMSQVQTDPVTIATEDIPRFRVDPFWASELPNNWILGQVSGVAVDDNDHVWIVHRPRSLDSRQRGEEGMCCLPAPPVIEFSPDGSVLQSWGGPAEGFEWPESEHGIHVDHQGHVWIGGNASSDAHVLKFTNDGQFLLQIGRSGQSSGSNDTNNLGRSASIEVDVDANEVYIADGYGNRRVIVYDAETGAYKRHWGAYGERPEDVELPPYDPATEVIRHFRSPVHDVTLSNDGLVYVADRTNNRMQLFQKDGQFVTEAFVRRETLGSGSVSSITLSTDLEQRWLFVGDGTNNVIWILDRLSLTVVDHFGRLGKNAEASFTDYTISTLIPVVTSILLRSMQDSGSRNSNELVANEV